MKLLNTLILLSFFLISISATAQSAKEETRKFNLIDADRNEVITIREMNRYYKEKTDKDGGPVDAKKLFYGLDANRNSIITLNEYIKGVDLELAYEFVDRWDYKITEENKTLEVDTEQDVLSEEFDEIDSNLDGALSYDEVVNYYKGKTDKETGKPVDGKLNFYTYDADNNGKITLVEFAKELDWKLGMQRLSEAENNNSTSNEKEVSESFIQERFEIFRKIDLDTNYKLTLEELKAYYKDKSNNDGEPINVEFKYLGMDTNEDGTIELAEFAAKIDVEYARKKYNARKL